MASSREGVSALLIPKCVGVQVQSPPRIGRYRCKYVSSGYGVWHRPAPVCIPGCNSAVVSLSISLSMGCLLPFAIALVLCVYQTACMVPVLATVIPVRSTAVPVYQYAQVYAPHRLDILTQAAWRP